MFTNMKHSKIDNRISKKIYNRGIKIARVNSILITKSINLQLFTLILYGVGVRCDQRRFSAHSRFIDKYMAEVIL